MTDTLQPSDSENAPSVLMLWHFGVKQTVRVYAYMDF